MTPRTSTAHADGAATAQVARYDLDALLDRRGRTVYSLSRRTARGDSLHVKDCASIDAAFETALHDARRLGCAAYSVTLSRRCPHDAA